MYMNYLVKIPKDVKGITRKKIRGVMYVYYIYERIYDSEKKYSVPRTTSIGKCDHQKPGMMYPNANYFRFFSDAETPKTKYVGKKTKKGSVSEKPSAVRNGQPEKRISEQELSNLWRAFEKSGRTFEEVIAFLTDTSLSE
ncbi:MAG: hypothetical protein IJP92_12320 [Lachnospiraceae bacterium]|nr:hypothetical protein [Lachnospiraceae bacterium]